MEWSLVPTSSAFPIPHTLSKANLLTHGCQSNSWASLTSSSSTAKVILSRYSNLSFHLSAFIAGGNICLSNMLLRQRHLLDINLKMRLFVLCKTHYIGGPARPTYCMQPYILHGKKFVWDIRKILNRQCISSDMRWVLESLESLNGRDSRCSHTLVRQSTDWSNTRSACSRVLTLQYHLCAPSLPLDGAHLA